MQAVASALGGRRPGALDAATHQRLRNLAQGWSNRGPAACADPDATAALAGPADDFGAPSDPVPGEARRPHRIEVEAEIPPEALAHLPSLDFAPLDAFGDAPATVCWVNGHWWAFATVQGWIAGTHWDGTAHLWFHQRHLPGAHRAAR